jgi:hypothetical protein
MTFAKDLLHVYLFEGLEEFCGTAWFSINRITKDFEFKK